MWNRLVRKDKTSAAQVVVVFDSYFTGFDIDSRALGNPTPQAILTCSDICFLAMWRELEELEKLEELEQWVRKRTETSDLLMTTHDHSSLSRMWNIVLNVVFLCSDRWWKERVSEFGSWQRGLALYTIEMGLILFVGGISVLKDWMVILDSFIILCGYTEAGRYLENFGCQLVGILMW